jgi:uroporphyrinogen-III synthase
MSGYPPLIGFTIGVTEPRPATEQIELLTTHGAKVVHGPTATAGGEVPDDPTAAVRLLDHVVGHDVDAVTFTTAAAVRHALALTPDPDRVVAALRGPVLAAATGPVTALALVDAGVRAVVEPATAGLESMVGELAMQLHRRSVVLSYDGAALRWQSSALITPDGVVADLTGSERRLLRAIVQRSPAVIPKLELAEPGTDEHAVESAIARLRIKLGPLAAGIRTVRRRGYGSAMQVLVGDGGGQAGSGSSSAAAPSNWAR